MSAQVITLPHKTAKPVIAGIFNIIIGAICILGVFGLTIAALAISPVNGDLPVNVNAILAIIAVPLLALGVMDIIGGVFALQRKMWGLALAGSITAACISVIFGVTSIVLTSISKDEFVK